VLQAHPRDRVGGLLALAVLDRNEPVPPVALHAAKQFAGLRLLFIAGRHVVVGVHDAVAEPPPDFCNAHARVLRQTVDLKVDLQPPARNAPQQHLDAAHRVDQRLLVRLQGQIDVVLLTQGRVLGEAVNRVTPIGLVAGRRGDLADETGERADPRHPDRRGDLQELLALGHHGRVVALGDVEEADVRRDHRDRQTLVPAALDDLLLALGAGIGEEVAPQFDAVELQFGRHVDDLLGRPAAVLAGDAAQAGLHGDLSLGPADCSCSLLMVNNRHFIRGFRGLLLLQLTINNYLLSL
jgi:hypothetical protein